MSLAQLTRAYLNDKPCTAMVEGSQVVLELRGGVEIVLPIRELEIQHIRRLPGRGDAVELSYKGSEVILIVPFHLRGVVRGHLGVQMIEPRSRLASPVPLARRPMLTGAE